MDAVSPLPHILLDTTNAQKYHISTPADVGHGTWCTQSARNEEIPAIGKFNARRTAILYCKISHSLSNKQFSGHYYDVIIMLYPSCIRNAVDLEIHTFVRLYVKLWKKFKQEKI